MNRAISGKWKIETVYIYTNMKAHKEKLLWFLDWCKTYFKQKESMLRTLQQSLELTDLGYIYAGKGIWFDN